MENQDYRLAQLVAQPPDGLHEIGGVVDVQVVGGLVQQDSVSWAMTIFRATGLSLSGASTCVTSQGSMTASYRMLAVPKSRPDCCMPRLSYCSEQGRVSHVVSLDPSGAFFGKIPTTSMAG